MVEAGRDQAGMQGARLGGPPVVGMFGFVEKQVSAHCRKFVPRQTVTNSQSHRSVSRVAALPQQIRIHLDSGPSGADAGPGG